MVRRTGCTPAPVRRLALVLAPLLAIGSGWGPALAAGGQDLPAGAILVSRHIAAIGGAEALRAVSSLRATGVTEFPAQNMRGSFEMLAARPAKSVLRMELGGIGKAETGFNGVVGWMLDPMVGPSLVTGRQLDEMRNDSHFDAALHPRDLVKSVTTTARVEFDGRPAFKAHVVFLSGQERDEYFDADRGYLLGIEGPSQTPMGVVPVTVMLRDYKAFGAISYPTRLVQSAMGIEQHFVFEQYEYNTVKPEAFDPPAIIRAIIKTNPAPAPSAEPAWRAGAVASFDEAWATINDSFYDPAFGGLNWAGLRDELRPRVTSARTADDARRVVVEMLGRLKRSHFVLMPAVAAADEPAPTGEATPGFDLRVLGGDVVITQVAAGSAAAKAGLAPGQLLLAVDDQPAASWWRQPAADADPRAAGLAVWRRVQARLRGAPGSRASLRVRDEKGERVVEVVRALESGDRVALGDLPPFMARVSSQATETPGGRPVGVIAFNVWMTPVDDPLARAIDRHRSAKGLVIDLRGNPGGLAAMISGLAGHLFTTTELLGRMKTRTSDLEFRANPRLVTPDGARVQPYAGPVALLVDELTASASECFAGALQSLGRARVFGRQTLGQALPASTRRLSNGDLLMYAVGDFVTATGRRLEGDGVQPDQVVPLSLQALRAGRDTTLEAALQWIDSQ